MSKVIMVSGHRDLTIHEFQEHYQARLRTAIAEGCDFVVGDAPGCDEMAQQYLASLVTRYGFTVTVYHKGPRARHSFTHFKRKGGYTSQTAKDAAMTADSDEDILWVRAGRQTSGTARNLERRKKSLPPASPR